MSLSGWILGSPQAKHWMDCWTVCPIAKPGKTDTESFMKTVFNARDSLSWVYNSVFTQQRYWANYLFPSISETTRFKASSAPTVVHYCHWPWPTLLGPWYWEICR